MRRDQNRAKFPAVTRVVDSFRDAFGADQVRVVWAREGGNEIGKP
jgi:hypothetical protein